MIYVKNGVKCFRSSKERNITPDLKVPQSF